MDRWVVVFLFLGFISCSNRVSQTSHESMNTIKELRWLDGCWLDTTTFSSFNPPVKKHERWIWYEDSIVGIGSNVIGSDTVITENKLITYVDTSIVLISRFEDKAMLSYNLVNYEFDSVVFENKAIDFPQKICFKKVNKDSVLTYFMGFSYDMKRKIRLSYFKSDF